MHKKNIIVAVLILAVFIIGGFAATSENDALISRNSPPAALTDMFVGTYNYEDNSRCSITVLPEENAFVYFDYDNENFFKGQFTQKTEDTYELTADDLDTCEIQCQDLKFKLTMGDSDLVFVKISENPIVPTNLEELLRGAVADYDYICRNGR